MKRRGRPILGAITGLIFGLMAGLDLTMFKVRTFDAVSIAVLPAAGLLLGIILGVAAPFGKRTRGATPMPSTPMAGPPPISPTPPVSMPPRMDPPPYTPPAPPSGFAGPGGGPTGPSEPH